jgi:hypothetical protein
MIRFSFVLLILSLVLQVGAAKLSSMVLSERKMIGLDMFMMGLSLLLILVAMVNFDLHKSYKFMIVALGVAPLVAVGVWQADGLNEKDILFKYPWWLLFMRIVCVSLFAIMLVSLSS